MEQLLEYFMTGWNNFGVYVVAFALVLGVLVFVHEWGHYIVARMCGVKVTTFSIGFGKELFGFHDRSGTRWRVAAIPLGGYVQMFGDADPSSSTQNDNAKEMTDEEKKVAFFYKPLWQRALIVFAGPAINFIFAVLLLFGLYFGYGQPVTPPLASAVVVDSAAADAGIEPYDEIVRMNGVAINRFEDIQREVAVALDDEIDITVLRSGEEIVFENVTPKRIEGEDRFGFKHSRGQLGVVGPSRGIDVSKVTAVNNVEVADIDATIAELERNINTLTSITLNKKGDAINQMLILPSQAMLEASFQDEDGKILQLTTPDNQSDMIKHSPLSAFNQSVAETASIVNNTFEALGQIFTGGRSVQELGGIVRIGAIAGDAAQAGWVALITFTALISINLGLINLFPIPVLDGGHLLFYAIEAVKGSPLSEKVQEYSFRFGFVVLIALMVFTNLNDIVQLTM